MLEFTDTLARAGPVRGPKRRTSHARTQTLKYSLGATRPGCPRARVNWQALPVLCCGYTRRSHQAKVPTANRALRSLY